MSVSRQPRWRIGSAYLPSILVERCTPGPPCGEPARPIDMPRETMAPDVTPTSDRYETDTLNPGTGSMVMVLIPATDPAKVTRPEAGATTVPPTAEA